MVPSLRQTIFHLQRKKKIVQGDPWNKNSAFFPGPTFYSRKIYEIAFVKQAGWDPALNFDVPTRCLRRLPFPRWVEKKWPRTLFFSETGGSWPYSLWEEALRWICLGRWSPLRQFFPSRLNPATRIFQCRERCSPEKFTHIFFPQTRQRTPNWARWLRSQKGMLRWNYEVFPCNFSRWLRWKCWKGAGRISYAL